MKFYDKNSKNPTEIHDISGNLTDLHNLGLISFPEEYSLTCPVENRSETVNFFTVSSWGDACHVTMQMSPVKDNPQLMKAKIEFCLRLKNIKNNSFYACEEEILNLNEMKNYEGNVTKFKIGSFLFENHRPFVNYRLVFRGFLTETSTQKKTFATVHFLIASIGKVWDNLSDVDSDFMEKQFQSKFFIVSFQIQSF